MNRIRKILSRHGVTKFFFITAFASLICLTSCNESSVVGLKVQPQSDLLNVGYQDTTTLLTQTVKVDSLRTDEDFTLYGFAQLGKYSDPIFGEATASIYTQLRTATTIASNSFGVNPVCQQVELSLVYDVNPAGFYGRADKKRQTVNVYALSDAIVRGNNYYAFSTLNHTSLDLANGFTFIPAPIDSVTVDGIRSKPQLRIPLDLNFGQTILNNQTTGVLATNDAFQAFMKGLYITTENTPGITEGSGNMMRFILDDAQSKVTIYYNNAGTVEHIKKFDLPLSSVARFVNYGHNNYADVKPVLHDQLYGMPPPANDPQLFIQAMGGLRAKITLPYLMNWVKNGAIGINKAELVIKTDLSANSSSFETRSSVYPYADAFGPPQTFVLGSINSDGTVSDLPDSGEGSSYYGGYYNNITHEYRFNIGRYIQQVLSGKKENLGLYLIIPPLGANICANRTVIGGADPNPNNPYRMKLDITYTKIH